MSFRAKVLTVGISLCIGVVLALLFGEVYLRLQTSPILRLQNNRIILPRNQFYRYHNIGLRGCDPIIVHHKNSLGFRGAEPPADFQNDLTLITVGGSTTECFYLSDGHSWPELLGSDLQKDFHRLWINNAGLDGHSTFGHTILIKDYVSDLHPKVVLLLVGVNDVGRDDLVPSDFNFLRANRDQTWWNKSLRALGENSRVIAWIQNIYRALAARKHGLSHHPEDLEKIPMLELPTSTVSQTLQRHQSKYLEGYESRLKTLVQLCQAARIHPVLITQPSLYGKGLDDVTHVNLETLRVDRDLNGGLAWRVLELYNDRTRKVCREEHIPCIDLARELPKSSNYFYDFYHFTNAGAAATATIVYRDLLPYLAQTYPQFLIQPLKNK
jgi:hypothetical protein